jgi:hypothetical protein
MASTWLVSTDKSSEDVATALHAFMDPQDFLLVAELSARYSGYLPQQAWDWITEQRRLETERAEKAKAWMLHAARGAPPTRSTHCGYSQRTSYSATETFPADFSRPTRQEKIEW